MTQELWGVDSAQKVTQELYDCVISNFGKPQYWGRYLTTVPNASDGLTKKEITFLHNKGVKILPIYNNFKKVTGFTSGKVTARNAIYHAKMLGIPNGKIIFGNIEKFFEVDDAWIRGWVEVFYNSDYKQGFYNYPVDGNFSNAYCTAVSKYNEVKRQTVLWSAKRDIGVTKQDNAPSFQPEAPPCDSNVWGWQYGRNAQTCAIDTNVIIGRLYQLLW